MCRALYKIGFEPATSQELLRKNQETLQISVFSLILLNLAKNV